MLVGTLPFIPDSPSNLSQLHSLLLKGCEIPNGLSEGNIYLSAIIHFLFKGSIHYHIYYARFKWYCIRYVYSILSYEIKDVTFCSHLRSRQLIRGPNSKLILLNLLNKYCINTINVVFLTIKHSKLLC